MRSSIICAFLGTFLGIHGSVSSQCEFKQVAKLGPPPILGAIFYGITGLKFELDGSTLFVTGSQPFGPPIHGAADVLWEYREITSGNWSLGQTLVAPNYGHITQMIALDGDRLCAGYDQGGAIVVFERVGGIWNYAASIPSSIVPGGSWQTTNGKFLLRGDRLFIGCPEAGATLGYPMETGAVFVLEYVNGSWTYQSTILPNLPFGGGRFGRDIDFDSNRLIVSALEPLSAYVKGVVYVFELESGSWIQKARIVPDDFSVPSGLGWVDFASSVALGDDQIVVGAFPTALYSFSPVGPFWLQTQKFSAPTAQSIGANVAIANERLVASIGASLGAIDTGALIVFENESDTWVDRLLLAAQDSIASAELGAQHISVDGDLVAAASSTGTLLANVRLFSTVPNPTAEFGVGCPGSGGFVPRLDDQLTYDGCNADGASISYLISKGLGGSSAVLMLSAQSVSIPLIASCTLLVAPSLSMITLPLPGIGPGNGSISLNASIPVGFPSISIYFQAFIADPGAPGGYCVSNGLRLTVH